MRSIVCNQFAPLSELQLEEKPAPELFPGSVRIAVTACGVNFVDGGTDALLQPTAHPHPLPGGPRT